MSVIVHNVTSSVSVSLTALHLIGWWRSDGFTRTQKVLYNFYTGFTFAVLSGMYLMAQMIDMFMIWGDLLLMTENAFVLFTMIVHAYKIVNHLVKRDRIQEIVKEADLVLRDVHSEEEKKIVKSCNDETKLLQQMFVGLTTITGIGWGASTVKGQLPLRAWYPYDTTKSPIYELTYCHQIISVTLAGYSNVAKDTLVCGLIAQCRCRLRLLSFALRTLADGINVSEKNLLTPEQEAVVALRLRSCVAKHQAAMSAVLQLQDCFSMATFFQFIVSLGIICVSAFQMVSQTGNMLRLISMTTYLLNMMFQVFIYCYQGHHLSEESCEVAGAAYECPWYTYSVRLRRSLLIVMSRTQRITNITAGNFIELSLASFTGILKASYSMFTVLRQVQGEELT